MAGRSNYSQMSRNGLEGHLEVRLEPNITVTFSDGSFDFRNANNEQHLKLTVRFFRPETKVRCKFIVIARNNRTKNPLAEFVKRTRYRADEYKTQRVQ